MRSLVYPSMSALRWQCRSMVGNGRWEPGGSAEAVFLIERSRVGKAGIFRRDFRYWDRTECEGCDSSVARSSDLVARLILNYSKVVLRDQVR